MKKVKIKSLIIVWLIFVLIVLVFIIYCLIIIYNVLFIIDINNFVFLDIIVIS